jgi:ABC-type multidrug transport system ATPase subunit
MSPTAPILLVENANKSFGSLRALEAVSLRLESGIYGLLGANGAGKSTLFRSILGWSRLDSGSIRVADLEVPRQSVEARRLIGYLAEEPELEPRLRAAEILELVAALRDVDGDGSERRDWLEFLGIENARDKLVRDLSLGMRQKLGLIVALLGRPRLALLDEPLNGLDVPTMARLSGRLSELARNGTTMLVSSHILTFAERICDVIGILHQGRLVAEGRAHDLRARVGLKHEPFEDVFLALIGDRRD